MPRDKLGSNQTIILHNCLIKNEGTILYSQLISQTNKMTNTKKDNNKKAKTNYQKSFFFKRNQGVIPLEDKSNFVTFQL